MKYPAGFCKRVIKGRKIKSWHADAGLHIFGYAGKANRGGGIIICLSDKAIPEKLDRLAAKDMHEIFLCNEVRSMVFCAKIFFRTSLLREESRGWFYREDFEKRDDENWLKWTVVTNENGEMKISYEPVPIENYPVKPSE